MNLFKITYSGCVVLMSSMLLVACSQSSDTQTGNNAAEEIDAVAGEIETPVVSKAGPTVSLSSANVSVYEGESFTLNIALSDFSTSEGGGITLRFDPALLQATNVVINEGEWNFKNMDGRINNAEGTISDILFSSYLGVEGDSNVATIEFKSIEKGVSSITLTESSANTFASDGQKVDVVFETTTVISN